MPPACVLQRLPLRFWHWPPCSLRGSQSAPFELSSQLAVVRTAPRASLLSSQAACNDAVLLCIVLGPAEKTPVKGLGVAGFLMCFSENVSQENVIKCIL